MRYVVSFLAYLGRLILFKQTTLRRQSKSQAKYSLSRRQGDRLHLRSQHSALQLSLKKLPLYPR